MSPETLSSLSAILLSLAFSYIPGLSDKFDALDGTRKRLIMLACLLLASLTTAGKANHTDLIWSQHSNRFPLLVPVSQSLPRRGAWIEIMAPLLKTNRGAARRIVCVFSVE